MRELIHILLADLAVSLPEVQPSLQASVDKRNACWNREGLTPNGDICDRIFAYTSAGEIVLDLTCVFAGEMELEDTVDAEDFVLETIQGDYVQEQSERHPTWH